jgi:hypothetical protein
MKDNSTVLAEVYIQLNSRTQSYDFDYATGSLARFKSLKNVL